MYRVLTARALDLGIDPETDPDAVVAMLDGLELEHRVEDGGGVRLFVDGEPVPESVTRVHFHPQFSG